MTAADTQRGTGVFPLGDREIVMRYPTEGQFLVLSQLPTMIEKDRKLDALTTFGDILDELIVQGDDRRYAYKGLINGTVQMSAYLELVVKLLEHMKAQAEEKAPTNGPPPRKRAAPRARR